MRGQMRDESSVYMTLDLKLTNHCIICGQRITKKLFSIAFANIYLFQYSFQ